MESVDAPFYSCASSVKRAYRFGMDSQSQCKVSGLPLFARVDANGRMLGISSHDEAEFGPHDAGPFPNGSRDLPLYGDEPKHDPVTQALSTTYEIAADRVTRTCVVREKTAAELLREISWWHAAMHARRSSEAAE